MLPVSIDMFSSSIEHDADDSYLTILEFKYTVTTFTLHSHLTLRRLRLMTITMTKTDDFDYCRLQGA